MYDISEYLKGNGLDVSRIKDLGKAKGFYRIPNNFYSLKEAGDMESFDFIYSEDIINETKFHRILIKEWLYACKVKGFVIIKMKDNLLLTFDRLRKECLITLGKKAKIIKSIYNEKVKSGLIIIKKVSPMLAKNDLITRWTFAILSDGKREEWVNREIKSIIALNIPRFEIIVYGAYHGPKYKNVRFLPFKASVSKIGAHKNDICKNAKYENIVITHDKYLFDKSWYIGMKKYGNYFEILSCVILENDGKRSADWVSYGTYWNNVPRIGKIDYRDWDKYGYISGGFYIIKKSVWKETKWDESLDWNQKEDVILSQELYKKGFIARFNPYSKCNILLMKHYLAGSYRFNKFKLGALYDYSLIYLGWYINQVIKKHFVNIDPLSYKIYNFINKKTEI